MDEGKLINFTNPLIRHQVIGNGAAPKEAGGLVPEQFDLDGAAVFHKIAKGGGHW
jgi:hypothetical protein